MRINNYSKFFAEVAKIMDTSIKAVKQLEGRYKIELTNHVYFYAFRGVAGFLVIHDRRGVSHITSYYNFEDFKTLKDLYDKLVSDYSEPEETEKHYYDYTSEDFVTSGIAKECIDCPDFCEEDCIENTECARGNDVFDGCKTVKEVMEVKQELNSRFGKEQVYKQMKAKHNPEWHHVSLRTLANIDNDMLDEKRRNYIFLYHLIKDFRKYAFEIKREDIYFDLVSNVLRNIQQLYFNNVISHKAYRYATRHVQVVSVEKGYFMSEREETFGFKTSRRYNGTLR